MKSKKKQGNKKATRDGFTVLYAMLIAALLLSIGLSIYNILLKDLTLSSEESDSQTAFFASDSGLECAQYWDSNIGTQSIFATSSQSQAYGGTADCGPVPVNIALSNYPAGYTGYSNPGPWSVVTGASSATTTFTVYYATGNAVAQTTGPCAIVSVAKSVNGNQTYTTIDSLGYNTCDVTSPQRVERSFIVSYII